MTNGELDREVSMECVVGIDVGSRTTKCVVMDHHRNILGRAVCETGTNLEKAAKEALDSALQDGAVSLKEIAYVASTGYGRYQVPERDIQITDITCHGMGAKFLYPGTRCVLDVGAQNSRAIKVQDNGRVQSFKMNEKCASGAGRFLERVAKSMEIDMKEIGTLSLRAEEPQLISNICAVLAESEVINHITAGKRVEDILMGAFISIGGRIAGLLKQLGIEEEVTLTGGVGRNRGMVKALSEAIGCELNVCDDSEYAGAIGACCLGFERLKKRKAL